MFVGLIVNDNLLLGDLLSHMFFFKMPKKNPIDENTKRRMTNLSEHITEIKFNTWDKLSFIKVSIYR